MKVNIITLGCPKNDVDSDLLAGLFLKEGFELADSADHADVVVVNTCGFILPAVEESIETILTAAQAKEQGRVKVLAVTGCLVQRYGTELKTEIPEIDILTGSSDHHLLPKLIKRFAGTKLVQITPDPDALFEEIPSATNNRVVHTLPVAYLRLAEGCSRSCAFCIIPKLRGKMRSRSIESVVREAQILIEEKNAKELVLVAQETTAYGHDLGIKNGLVQLLERLLKLNGKFWIRLLYTHPLTLRDGLIRFYAHNVSDERLVPYIDLPLQHVSDKVLQYMNRGYTGRFVRRLVEKLHAKIPNLILRGTFLVGHPGETRSTFRSLLKFVEEGWFLYGGAFKFYAEEGTPAALEADKAPDDEEALEMKLELEAALINVMQNRLQQFENRYLKLLIEEPTKPAKGRFYGQAPEIDGVVLIDTDPKRRPAKGDFVVGKVTKPEDSLELAATDLFAKLVPVPLKG